MTTEYDEIEKDGTDNKISKGLKIEPTDPDIYTPVIIYVPTSDISNGPAIEFNANNDNNERYVTGMLVIEADNTAAGGEDTYFAVQLKDGGADKIIFTVAGADGRIQFGTNQRVRMNDSGLTGTRTFTFPDADSKLIGNDSTDVTLADGKDFALGSTNGTKIGTATTQKLGFFNKTPITQKAANADTSGATLGQLETEVNELKQLLRDYGLLA